MFRSLLLRSVLPLLLAAGVVAFFALPYVDRLLRDWFSADMQVRARLVMSSLQESLDPLVDHDDLEGMGRLANRVSADERLMGLMICDDDGRLMYETARASGTVSCPQAMRIADGHSAILRTGSGSVQLSMFSQHPQDQRPYSVGILYDMSFVDRRQTTAREYVITFGAVSVAVLAAFLVLGAWLVLRRWGNVLVHDISGRRFLDNAQSAPLWMPVLRQVRKVLHEMEESQRLEIDYRENWTPQALQQVVRDQLHSPRMVVVSNREPYSHDYTPTGGGARAGAGERHGHGARAGHAGLLGYLGRSRQRSGGPRGGRPTRSRGRAARRAHVHAAARVAVAGGKKRASTTASPTRASGRCAIWPMSGRLSAMATGSRTAT